MSRIEKKPVKTKDIKPSVRDQAAADKREHIEMLRDVRPKNRKFLTTLLKPHAPIKPRKQPRTLPIGMAPPPPDGYASWMEYAVINTHLGTIYDDSIFGIYPWSVTREELNKALLNEYLALCKSAGVAISEESRARLERQFL